MRGIAYAIAVLVAAGMVYLIAFQESSNPAQTNAAAVQAEPASLTLNVPEMHCIYACFPSVKENLESREDVISVELVKQKEEGPIDTPNVIVTYSAEFDVDDAVASLEKEGFPNSSVVE